MLDIAYLRDNKDKGRPLLKNRAPKLDFDALLALDADRRQLQRQLDELRSKKNKANEEISQLLKSKQDTKGVIATMKAISQEIDGLEAKTGEKNQKLQDLMYLVPNLPHKSVKIGADSTENTQVSSHGDIKKFGFKPKDHIEIGEALGIFDGARGSKITGSGFVVFGKEGARLERVLINFM